jgi:splicing factor 3A subunit 3
MCTEKESSKWDPDLDEQFEDSKGNVLTRRTFEDLRRQGLL